MFAIIVRVLKPKLLCLSVVCSVVSIGGCGQSNQPSQSTVIKVEPIRFAIAQAPLNLDPRYATDAASERVNRLIYRSLIDFDKAAKPKPDLATWLEISPSQYRFTLLNSREQPRSVFHDHTPLTAQDVVATYQSFSQLKDSPHRAEFANISRVEALNDDVVDFYLTRPDSNFVTKLIIGILPNALIKADHNFAHQPIGSGPLKFVSWKNNLQLQRIADQQDFVLSEVKDPTVRVLKLMRGEADLLQGDLPPELVKYLQKQNNMTVQSSIGANFSYIGFNMRDAVLSKLEVRQAIAHAIDRKAIIQQAMLAGSREAGSILPPEHWADNPNLSPYDYNPKLARELLQNAGIKLPLKLVYKTSTDPQRIRLATMMQAQMTDAGIELEIRSLDWGTFFSDIKQGNFQLYGLTWVGIKTPEIYAKAFGSQSLPPQGANRGHFQDSALDDLMAQAQSNSQQSGDWQKVTAYIHQALPYVPLWYEGQFSAMRKDGRKTLVNYELQSDGNWDGLKTIKGENAH